MTVERLGHLLARVDERGRSDLPLLGVSVAFGVRQRTEGDGRPAPSLDLSGYKVVRPGDIIMNALGKPHGSIGRSEVLGITSPAYWVLRCLPLLDSRFAHHLLRSSWAVSRYAGLGKNLPPNQFDIPWEIFGGIEVHLPALDEQRRIAEFLDDRVARIDQIIAARQQQIATLQEKSKSHLARQMLTNENLTPLRRLIGDERLGLWGDEPAGDENDVAVARVADFARAEFLLGEVPTRRSAPRNHVLPRLLQVGDVLLERSGGTNLNPVGCPAFVRHLDGPTVSSNFVSRLRPTADVDGRYLALVMGALYATRRQEPHSTQTTGIQNLNPSSYFAISIPKPDLNSQVRIAEEADRTLHQIESQQDQLRTSVTLFQEYKQSLITAAVTGEFDVTTASTKIPE